MISYTYDSEGKTLTTTDGLSHTTTNAYDELGRLKSVTDPLTHTTSYEYDKNNNLTKVIDAKTNSTFYTYDKLNRLIQVKDSLNNSTIYTYNAIGGISTITDAENHTTTNTYDGAGRLIQIQDPLNKITQYSYDANANLNQKIDANNQVTEYEYDNYNQLTKVFYGGKTTPVKTVSFSYDDVGNMLSWGDGTYSATQTYDELNRLTSLSTVYPFGTKTLSYTYDRFGNKKTLVYPDSPGSVTYNYNNLNQLTQLIGLGSEVTQYDYDNASRLTKKTLPNGVFTEYSYNHANQLTNLTNKKSDSTFISNFTYTLDNVGNREAMSTPEGTHSYGYDNIYRLTSTDHPIQADESYTYDKVGNRKSSSLYPNWTYDANNRLTSYNGTSYTYDDNGNMIRKEGTVPEQGLSLTYDYENRLIAISGTANASYTYDPFGKRLSKTVDGVTKYYLYGSEDIIAEYDPSGSLITSYLHGQGIDEPIQGLSPTGTVPEWYYTFDGLGSISEITDSSQNIVESYKYDSFGNFDIPPATGNPYTYTAREYDSESGLYYYRARYYDAAIGRFLSEDPILKLNVKYNYTLTRFLIDWPLLSYIYSPYLLRSYSYVGNNPINRIDPLGLIWWDPTSWSFPGTTYCGYWSSGPLKPKPTCDDKCCKQHDDCLRKSGRSFANLGCSDVRNCHLGLIRCLHACQEEEIKKFMYK